MNTAFYKYDNIRLKEISIMDAFEQIQENTIAGSACSARQLGRGFHARPEFFKMYALSRVTDSATCPHCMQPFTHDKMQDCLLHCNVTTNFPLTITASFFFYTKTMLWKKYG